MYRITIELVGFGCREGITKVKLIHQLIAYAAENAEIIEEKEV